MTILITILMTILMITHMTKLITIFNTIYQFNNEKDWRYLESNVGANHSHL